MRLRLVLAESAAAWVPCPLCADVWCTIHLRHVFECACPPIEDWSVDPYVAGRPPRHEKER